MTSTRRISGPLRVTGHFHGGIAAHTCSYQSVEDAYYDLSRYFQYDAALLDPSCWARSKIVIRDEFGGYVAVELVIADFEDLRREAKVRMLTRQMDRIGLTDKQGYRFRRGPVRTRSTPRCRWWGAERQRHLRSGLLEALVIDEETSDYEALLRRDYRRSRWATALWGDLHDEDFPNRYRARNWKAYRETQWKQQA
jgi:hypothetical protein